MINIKSLIKRLLYLNRNKHMVEDVFKIAIVDRLNDLNKIVAAQEKRKALSVINRIALG